MHPLARLFTVPMSLLLVNSALTACSSDSSPASESSASSRTAVVTAFYPLAFVAERIGGTRVVVRDLTPKGAEPHDLEPTADQVNAIEDDALVVVMGRGFQPSVEKAADKRKKPTVRVLDAVVREVGNVAAEGGGPVGIDPHVWLDPVRMKQVVGAVLGGMIEADPDGRASYTANATALDLDLDRLDRDYASGLKTCARKEIVTSHEAFGQLAARYGLRQEGITGLSPDAEPDPKRLAELIDLVKQNGVTTIFTEDLVSPELAKTLSRETGATTVVLSPLEVLTDDAPGADYLSVMRDNLRKLRTALGCQ